MTRSVCQMQRILYLYKLNVSRCINGYHHGNSSKCVLNQNIHTQSGGQDQTEGPDIVPVHHLLAGWFIEEKRKNEM